MEQLRNIDHSFDVALGDVGVTIRKGSKWYDLSDCQKFELRICPGAHDGVCNSLCHMIGVGQKIGCWKGSFNDIPKALIRIEHNNDCKDKEVLRDMMERAYPGFQPSEIVTALIYLRLQ